MDYRHDGRRCARNVFVAMLLILNKTGSRQAWEMLNKTMFLQGKTAQSRAVMPRGRALRSRRRTAGCPPDSRCGIGPFRHVLSRFIFKKRILTKTGSGQTKDTFEPNFEMFLQARDLGNGVTITFLDDAVEDGGDDADADAGGGGGAEVPLDTSLSLVEWLDALAPGHGDEIAAGCAVRKNRNRFFGNDV